MKRVALLRASSRSAWHAALALAWLLFGGCVSEGAAVMDDGGDAPSAHVQCPDTLPETQVGVIARAETGLQVDLIDADFLPARDRWNHWRMRIETSDGAPVEDATLSVSGFMGFGHNHYTTYDPRIAQLEDGAFEVDIAFQMTGPWEIQLTVDSESAGHAYLTFETCVK